MQSICNKTVWRGRSSKKGTMYKDQQRTSILANQTKEGSIYSQTKENRGLYQLILGEPELRLYTIPHTGTTTNERLNKLIRRLYKKTNKTQQKSS